MNSGEQEPIPTDRILTVPNVLSIVRLLALPLFAYLLLVTHSDGWALALLMLSGFTDWLDGKRTDLRVNAINVTDPHVLAGVQAVSTNAQDTIGRNGTVIAGSPPAYYIGSGAAVMATISRAF